VGARFFLRDSSGVPQQIKRLFIRDASGVPQAIKRLFIRDASGVPQFVFALYHLKGTLTVANVILGSGPSSVAEYGYIAGSLGALTPTTTQDGHPVSQIMTQVPFSGNPQTTLSIAGFSSDPGTGYLTSIVLTDPSNGVHTFLGSNAMYNFTGGNTANWTWTTTTPVLNSALGNWGVQIN